MCGPEYLASTVPLFVRAASDSPAVSAATLPFLLTSFVAPLTLLTFTAPLSTWQSTLTFLGARILKRTEPDQSAWRAVFQRQPILHVSASLPSMVTSIASRAALAVSSS